MSNRLNVTQLDFDTIKENLKTFLQNQSEFQDYNFEGSGLNILLDILAYNTHYNAYYLNMVANESFLDTALLRDSVVSHAKTLGYTPYSRNSSSAVIDIQTPVQGSDATLTIPRGFSFRSEIVDNQSFNFVVLEDVIASSANGNFYFEDVEIHEGTLVTYNFTYNSTTNPKRVFTIPDKNIDTKTLRVAIRDSESNTDIEVYTLSTDILNIQADTPVFFLQESLGELFQIYFGDGVIGKNITNGCIVSVSYLVTNGDAANKLTTFIATSSVDSYNNFNITLKTESAGGADKQTVDSIKYSATSQFSTQNRLVTINDYESYLMKNYPAVDSLSIWGGEEEVPPIYGKVFVSIKPKDDYYLSQTEKERIVDEIIDPKAMISITTEIKDPEYLFILISTTVRYIKNKTTLSVEQLKNAVRNKILSYNNTNLNKFSAVLVVSRLQDDIDSSDNSIIGNDVTIRLQKKFTPILNRNYSYTINFNVPLKKGTSSSKLTSSEFYVKDINNNQRLVSLEEIPNSDTGITKINVVNPGSGYTSVPTVTVTGDGYGAEAIAKIVNGKIESFEIIKRGFDYSKAVVTISGGGGSGTSGIVIIDAKVGELRTVYFDVNAERKIVNATAGTVDYDTGTIKLTDIEIINTVDSSSDINIMIESEIGILESVKNTILFVDESNPASIEVITQGV